MTAQIEDSIIYSDKEYNISAIENVNDFFDIHSLGLTPEGVCTACWRGYVAVFLVDENNQLLLKRLYANNGDLPAPVINDVTARIVQHIAGDLFYDNVNVPINYSGSLLITEDFIEDRYVHMGFQSPWSYKKVMELTFSDGMCIKANNLSSLAAEMRKATPNVEKRVNVSKWIEDCFDLSYSKK